MESSVLQRNRLGSGQNIRKCSFLLSVLFIKFEASFKLARKPLGCAELFELPTPDIYNQTYE